MGVGSWVESPNSSSAKPAKSWTGPRYALIQPSLACEYPLVWCPNEPHHYLSKFLNHEISWISLVPNDLVLIWVETIIGCDAQKYILKNIKRISHSCCHYNITFNWVPNHPIRLSSKLDFGNLSAGPRTSKVKARFVSIQCSSACSHPMIWVVNGTKSKATVHWECFKRWFFSFFCFFFLTKTRLQFHKTSKRPLHFVCFTWTFLDQPPNHFSFFFFLKIRLMFCM